MPVTLTVKDLMDKNVVFINSKATVLDAVKKMLEKEVWALVVEKQGLPEGVVTERDVIRRCLANNYDLANMTVENIMSSPLVTISPDTSIREAMSTMAEKNIRRLFVVDKGKIVGRLTQTHLFDSSLDVMTTLSSLSGQL